jgi:23S rRNA pseudouridine2604 synthase
MATITLKGKPKPAAKTRNTEGDKRAPVRGKGVSKPRPTLAKAQADRAEREERYQKAQRDERPAPSRDDRPPRPGARPERSTWARPDDRNPNVERAERAPRRPDERGPRGRPDERGPRFQGDERGPRGPRDDRGPQHRPDDRGPRGRPDERGPRFQADDRGPRGPRDDRGPYARPDERGPRWQQDERGPRGPRDERGPQHRPDDRGPRARPDDRGPYARPDDRGPRWQQDERGPRGERGPHGRPDERAPAERPPRVDQRRASNRGPDFDAPRPQRRNNPAREVAPEDGERLSKRMGELKMASRREADDWIAAGWVRVNGKVAVLGQRVGPDVQIDIDPAARSQQAQLVTVLLHKPIGYVSGQAEDGYDPAVVLFQLENHWKEDPSSIKHNAGHHRNLAPAGRLDIDSTGLLVLTQDGRIARVLIGEDSDIEKEYLVRVEYVGLPGAEPVPEGTLPNAALAPEQLALLNHGLELDGELLKSAKVSWQNEHQLRFVLREGKKRQIRRMCELVGLKVVGLKRVRIGRIPLGHLPVGQWRYLAPWEKF